MSAPRKASEVDVGFPYGWPKKVCYFYVNSGDHDTLMQISGRDDMREVVTQALKGEVTIYAVWPGSWKSDLFVIDKPSDLARAIGVTS